LDELSQRLLPYHLPAGLVTLYGWHDGWQDSLDGAYRPLLPDATFNSLADATGAVTVELKRETTEHFRELTRSGRY
jgi:hypothetical protein